MYIFTNQQPQNKQDSDEMTKTILINIVFRWLNDIVQGMDDSYFQIPNEYSTNKVTQQQTNTLVEQTISPTLLQTMQITLIRLFADHHAASYISQQIVH